MTQGYQCIVKSIKRHPISGAGISQISSEDLQKFMNQVTFGGKDGDFDSRNGYAREYAKKFMAVLNHAFRYLVAVGKRIK